MTWFPNRTAKPAANSEPREPSNRKADPVRAELLLVRAQERRALGDLVEAQSLAKEALDQGERAHGEHHPALFRSSWSTPDSSTSARAGPPASRSTTAPNACAGWPPEPALDSAGITPPGPDDTTASGLVPRTRVADNEKSAFLTPPRKGRPTESAPPPQPRAPRSWLALRGPGVAPPIPRHRRSASADRLPPGVGVQCRGNDIGAAGLEMVDLDGDGKSEYSRDHRSSADEWRPVLDGAAGQRPRSDLQHPIVRGRRAFGRRGTGRWSISRRRHRNQFHPRFDGRTRLELANFPTWNPLPGPQQHAPDLDGDGTLDLALCDQANLYVFELLTGTSRVKYGFGSQRGDDRADRRRPPARDRPDRQFLWRLRSRQPLPDRRLGRCAGLRFARRAGRFRCRWPRRDRLALPGRRRCSRTGPRNGRTPLGAVHSRSRRLGGCKPRRRARRRIDLGDWAVESDLRRRRRDPDRAPRPHQSDQLPSSPNARRRRRRRRR